MTQAITHTAPSAYGLAFRQVYRTASDITADQRESLSNTWALADTDAYRTASRRLDEAMDLLDVERRNFYSPALINDTVYAVLAFDRGLISCTDFEAITGAWTLAGLPLPMQLDGDEAIPPHANLDFVTSDALADELLHATADTDQYGAAVMLTGYNHGELLAYPSVRACIDRRDNGDLIIDWDSLRDAVDGCDDLENEAPVDELEGDAVDALEIAISLLPHVASPDDDEEADESLAGYVGERNGETFVLAAAFSLGVGHLLQPAKPAAVVPQPRQWEPSA